MATFRFELNGRPSKDGKYVVYLRETIDGKRRLIKTSVTVNRPSNFNTKTKRQKWVRGNSNEANKKNQLLSQILENSKAKYSEHENHSERPGYKCYSEERVMALAAEIEPTYGCDMHVGLISKDRFEIEITEFSFGWMKLVFNINGIEIPFTTSYVGAEPLGSLIEAVIGLEECDDGYQESRYFLSWVREPGRSDIELVRNVHTDKLKININLDADIRAEDESTRKWEIEDFDYSVFKDGVLKCVFSTLKKYGLLGYSMTWDASDGYKFPFDALLKVLGVEANFDEGTGSYRSDIISDLKTIANNL